MRESFEAPALRIIGIPGIPEVKAGDNVADLIMENFELYTNDVVVVTQKIVSKAEGRVVALDPNRSAEEQIEELIRSESRRILRQRGSLFITETNFGYVCANAGIDQSNVPEGTVALLPRDPDRSARRIRDRILAKSTKRVGVIISDTFGRTWRQGLTDVALGVAGIAAVVDLRGVPDANGRTLNATQIALADELAGAAELAKPKGGRVGAVVIRGVSSEHFRESSVAEELLRPYGEDLFR
ncbi:MAG: coenzyme F420-0:L-glutamate ligase [Nitrospiraceae bacterium]|nr:coenzyme F420-0:L-glutamate ligase [Nitrospiraceae bacterium]MDA8262055.1 coenzyme F420-0:L-glutamate ligase [Actinomycetota bacterium]